MSESNLQIRISALIEGLDDLANLSQTLEALLVRVSNFASSTTEGAGALGALNTVTRASDSDFSNLSTQIQALQTALTGAAGTASQTGVAITTGTAAAQVGVTGLSTSTTTLGSTLAGVSQGAGTTQVELTGVATVADSVATGLSQLDTNASGAATGLSDLSQANPTTALSNLSDTSSNLNFNLLELPGSAQRVATELDQVSGNAGESSVQLIALGGSTGETTTQLESLEGVSSDSGQALLNLGNDADAGQLGVEGLAGSTDTAQVALSGLGGDATGASDSLSGVGGTSGETAEVLTTLGDSSDTLTESLGGLSDGSVTVGENVTTVGDSSSTTTDTFGGLVEGIDGLQGSLDGVATPATVAGVSVSNVGESAVQGQSRVQLLTERLAELAAHFTGLNSPTGEVVGELHSLESQAQAVETQAGNLRTRLHDLASRMGLTGTAAESAANNILGLANRADGGTAAIDILGSVTQTLVAGLMAVAGVSISLDYLKDAAVYAGRVETLGITLGVVGENAGYSKKELSGYEVELKKLGISTEVSREAMSQMMQAGLGLGAQLGKTTPQVLELARASQDLAVVTGENSSETMKRLIENIQQMDTEGLKFMGLMVDISGAQDKFAASLGVSSGALTEAQKRQAVANETLAQASKLSGSYELSMEAVGKKVSSLTRYSEELSLSIGNKLLPIYGALVDTTGDVLKALGKQAEAFDKSGSVGKQFGDGVTAAIKPLTGILGTLFNWVLKVAGSFAPAVKGIGLAIGSVLSVIESLALGLDTSAGIVDILVLAITALSTAFLLVADGFKVIEAILLGFISVVAQALSGIVGIATAIAGLLHLPQAWVDKMKESEKAFGDFSKTTEEKANKIVEAFAKGDTETQKLLQSLNGLSDAAKKIDPTPAQKFKDEIIALTRTQTENTKSSIEVAAAQDKIKEAMDKAVASNQLSQKEYDNLSVRLGNITKVMNDELNKAFDDLGTSSSELATGIGKDAGIVVGALQTIAQNGLATATQFQAAFAENVSVASNITELNKFSELLSEAGKRWPTHLTEFKEAQAQVGIQFEEMYAKELEAMSTSAEWGDLKDVIVDMGAKGTISVSEMALALEKGEKAVNRLNPAFIAASSASTALGVAISGIDDELEKLDTALQATATKAETSYTNIAKGYSSIGTLVSDETTDMVTDLEHRYGREEALIDALVTSSTEAERLKSEAVDLYETEILRVLNEGSVIELGLIEKAAVAQRASAAARIAALDEETIKVETALGENTANREEYERKLKDIDTERRRIVFELEGEIRQKKLDVLLQLKDAYISHIDKINAEEERALSFVQSIEEQKRQAKMSTEERIAAIQKGALDEFERYEVTKSEVANFQALAREAAAKGEFDIAQEYIGKAKEAAVELNTTVQEGEKLLVDKKQAADNATAALIETDKIQQSLFDREKAGYIDTATKARESAATKKVALQGVISEIDTLRTEAEKETKIEVRAETEDAKKKLTELKNLANAKENVMTMRVDAATAKETIDNLVADIEAGATSKVEMDVTAGRAALEKLKAYAEQTSNTQLALDATEALAKIDTAKQKLSEMGAPVTVPATVTVNDAEAKSKIAALTTPVNVEVKVAYNDGGAVAGMETLTKLDGTKVQIQAPVDSNVNQVADAWGNLYDKSGQEMTTYVEVMDNAKEAGDRIYKITALDGTVTLSDHVTNTNADETRGKIEALNATTGVEKTVMDFATETNAPETKQTLEDVLALGGSQVQAWIDVATNADETRQKVEAATEAKNVESTANVATNADETKTKVEGVLALGDKSTESQVNIKTDAEQAKAQVDAVLTEKDAKSSLTIKDNAEDVLTRLDKLQRQTQNTHTVIPDTASVDAEIKRIKKNTYSSHTIYGAGMMFFAEGGDVGSPMGSPSVPNLPASEPPMLSSGVVPGVGNSDTIPRTLEEGSFVIRKQAVQASGGERLLRLIKQANTLPAPLSLIRGKVQALLTPGEIVVSKTQADTIGRGNLHYINRHGYDLDRQWLSPRRFAAGGDVVQSINHTISNSSEGMGSAEQKGGSVQSTPNNTMSVDLRSNSGRATVQTETQGLDNLLIVLGDLKARSG